MLRVRRFPIEVPFYICRQLGGGRISLCRIASHCLCDDFIQLTAQLALRFRIGNNVAG
jgi:hypothetical protein